LVGTVRIRMYDGTLRELKEVRYIPNMTKNEEEPKGIREGEL